MAVALELKPLFDSLVGADPEFRIEFWDGSHLGPDASHAKATAVVHSPDAIRHMVWAPGELGLARAFVVGDIDILGDPYVVTGGIKGVAVNPARLGAKSIIDSLRGIRSAGGLGRRPARPATEAVSRGRLHSKKRDSDAISHHYDVGNDFYRLVLGPSWTYSCARFTDPTETLEDAQANKYDLVARKLGLKEGMRFLDVGCGWGGMVLHAVQNYGVKAVGITLSREQAAKARERVEEAGLTDSIEIRIQDYRDLKGEKFDAISSIGMFEHVGRNQMTRYFESLYECLEGGGRLLNHAIDSVNAAYDSKHGFVAHFVFPDGELQDLGVVVGAMQDAGFEVRDIETLREHYAMTLRCWVSNLQANWDKAVKLVGKERARVWLLYMIGSAFAFERNSISIHQTIATKTTSEGASNMPLTRHYYA